MTIMELVELVKVLKKELTLAQRYKMLFTILWLNDEIARRELELKKHMDQIEI